MRRNVALISAAVTAFTLVVLVSVVYAYSGLAAAPSPSGAVSGQSVRTVQVADSIGARSAGDTGQPAMAAPAISAQTAASLAAAFLHRTDLFSAEMTAYNGAAAFKVTFASGEIVYVSLGGQILGVVPVPSYVQPASPSGSGGGGWTSGSSGEHDDAGSETEHESAGSGSGG